MTHPHLPWKTGRYSNGKTDEGPLRLWNAHGAVIGDLPLGHELDTAFIVRAVNSHAALVELAEKIAEQDEFTYSLTAPLHVRQAYALINKWRERAANALRQAKGD